mgnify:CR=1 FL=1
MKFEYTTPEIEVTLFATESIMADSSITVHDTPAEDHALDVGAWLD